MNSSHIIELIEVINEEIRVFGDLLDLLQTEQSAIVGDDAAGIEETAAQKHTALEDAQRQEARRQRLVLELSEDLDVAPEKVDLSCLIQAVGGQHGEELARMRDMLMELNRKISATNENNAFLIRQSLRFTDRSLDILTGHPGDRGMYGNLGKPRKRDATRSVMNRTA